MSFSSKFVMWASLSTNSCRVGASTSPCKRVVLGENKSVFGLLRLVDAPCFDLTALKEVESPFWLVKRCGDLDFETAWCLFELWMQEPALFDYLTNFKTFIFKF